MSNWKEFLTRKNVLVLLGLLLVIVALPLATVLVKQSQETRKKAAGCPLGASSRSSVRFVNLNGEPITAARTNDLVRAEVNVGGVDAADIVLGFNNAKLEFDTAFGTGGISKSSAGGLTHFGASGSVDESGTPNVKRILFIVQRAHGATATGGKIATIGFKVKSTTTNDTTQIIYGERTTLALNGEGGYSECGTPATLTLNGAAATAAPTQVAATPFPTVAPSTGSNALYLSDDLPTSVAPGAAFTAHIRVRNTGTDTWNTIYGISPLPFGSTTWGVSGQTLPTGISVGPGQEHTFTYNLTAPATAGTYDCLWQMQGYARLFGQMGGKSITVGSGGPTNTPVPTATQPAAGSGNFSLATQTSSLVPSGGGAVTGTFSTDVFFNSQGVSTKNFQVAFHFDSAKIKVASVGPAAAHLQGDANSGAGASSYVLLRTNVGDAFTKVYGTAGGAAEKIGTITFQFQGTNKQANVTFDAAGSWIMNSVGDVAVTAAAPNYCYFMTGGTCDVTSPTNTPAAISTSTPAPTNTPVPTATPIAFPTTTPNSMGDNAQYIADDLPTTATPGQVITAHITMKNTGTTTWKATERFHGLSASPQCAGSACRWGSSGVLVGADVAPQATYQFTLNLTAPTTADTYDAFWQMVQSGELFGQKGGKRITVAAAVAPTTTVPACTKSTFPDATGDGKVCMVDFQRWVNELTHADGLNTTTADFNCPADGAVSVIDFQIWVNYVRDHGLSTGCGS